MENADQHPLRYIADQFELDGVIQRIEAFGSGHINDTYLVITDNMDSDGYVMQRINHHVFPDIDGLMNNILIVTSHLQAKLKSGQAADASWKKVLSVVKSHSGSAYYTDKTGNYWRFFDLISGAKSYDIVETQQQAREGGKAFGKFQALLSDLDPRQITEILPGFHHIGKRLEKFESAVSQDSNGRAKEVGAEISYIRLNAARMKSILERADNGLLPLRITHNDTKFNNLLLDREDQALCVIDLDTVMPGFVAYDFGDAIRTIINRAAEDEADLNKVKLNIPLFEAYTQGYMENAGAFLTAEEIDSLIDGVLLLPYMQATRFLTDYLEGDQYFKIKHPSHNLQRTRAQIRLVQELIAHETILVSLIKQAADQV